MAITQVDMADAVCENRNSKLNAALPVNKMARQVWAPWPVESLWNPHPECMNLRKPTEWSDSTKVVGTGMYPKNHVVSRKAGLLVT